MPYQQRFTRNTPGCIIVLLDRSHSMHRPWGGSNMTLAAGAARAVNQMLFELGVRSNPSFNEMRHYLDVAVFGYGHCPSAQNEGVESALEWPGIVPLPELALKPMDVRLEPSLEPDMPPSRMPVWVEPVFGDRTPMCQAMAVAGEHVLAWTLSHRDSFPPIVINITDGYVTDEPFLDADLAEWTRRLAGIGTDDGNTVVLNVFLAPEPDSPVWFPPPGTPLPDPGGHLLTISSPLPPPMVNNARAANIGVPDGARALVFNVGLSALVKFLAIGTNLPFKD